MSTSKKKKGLLSGKVTANVSGGKVSGAEVPPVAGNLEISVQGERVESGEDPRRCVYQGGYDPAFEWIEVSTMEDRTRVFIRGPRIQDDGRPGLAVR